MKKDPSSDDSEKCKERPLHASTISRSLPNLLTRRNDFQMSHCNGSQSQRPLWSNSLRMQGLMRSFVCEKRFRGLRRKIWIVR